MREISPGVYSMSMEEYIAFPAVSRTVLVTALGTPAAALAARDHPKDTTDAMRLGTATHMAALEPAEVAKHFALYKGKPKEDGELPKKVIRSGQHWEQHKQNAISQGMDPFLTLEKYELALSMGRALKLNDVSRRLFERKPATNELTIVFEIELQGVTIPIKVRIDCLIRDEFPTQADLKTAANVQDFSFTRSIIDYGYDIQAWLYRKAFISRTQVEVTNFVIAAVEKTKSIVVGDELTHAVRVFEMEPWLKGGEQRGLTALNIIAACTKAGEWPAYPSKVERLEPPKWYRQQWSGR